MLFALRAKMPAHPSVPAVATVTDNTSATRVLPPVVHNNTTSAQSGTEYSLIIPFRHHEPLPSRPNHRANT